MLLVAQASNAVEAVAEFRRHRPDITLVATILYGMAVQAAGGASRGKLQRVLEMALRTLPL
jgi:hypothetical protein